VSFESKANPTRVLWKPYKTRIWKSFAKQLPDAKALRGRKLLLIDLAVRGNGIQGATHLVREFLKDGHCPDCETRSLGLLYHQPRDTTEFVLREAGIDVIVLNQKYPRLTEDLTQELLKPYAPYSSFDPRIHLRPEANPLHAEFLASLKARLTGDTAECLKTYLRSPGGALARP
jgi:hypothetical protein